MVPPSPQPGLAGRWLFGPPHNRQGMPAAMVGLSEITADAQQVAVAERVIAEMPFARLIRFEAELGGNRPVMLIIAPLSGMCTGLLYDMVAALLPEHELYLLAWNDAADVPVTAGRFGLDENIDYVIDALRRLGGRLHLVGLCQSALPALAATALLETVEPRHSPLTLTLLGGKLDTRINPTRLDELTRSLPLDWFRAHAVTEVLPPHAGQGRAVYATYTQAMAGYAYLSRHLTTSAELSRKLFLDDGSAALSHPFLPLFLSKMNVPAELFLDIVENVFHTAALPLGLLRWHGTAIRTADIRHTGLLTIEGSEDDISGCGQTEIAHTLCPNIARHRRFHHLQADTGHFGLFHGRRWREEIMPQIRAFTHAEQNMDGRRGSRI